MNAMSHNGAGLEAGQTPLGLTIETLQAIVGHSPVGICVTDPDGIVEIANRAFVNLCGDPETGVLGRHITSALPTELGLPAAHQGHLPGGIGGDPAERTLAGSDRQKRSILASAIHILDDHGRPKILTYALDVTEHRMLERQLRLTTELLEQLSTHDWLTGAFNRRHAEAVLAKEVGRSGRSVKPLSLALVSVDNVGNVDEALGETAGDKVLVDVARSLKGVIRETDTLGRLEGEQFLIILPFTAVTRAVDPLRRARARLAAERAQQTITFSAGVTEHRSGETPQEFCARADRLLARARADGGDTILHSGVFDGPV